MTTPLSDVSRETKDRLDIYHELLIRWQKRINLIGNGDEIWNRHFIDSAQLLKLIPDPQATLLDMGTGAGFPGMVLAILGMPHVHLVESDTKKITFLREVARQTQTLVTLHHGRVEKLSLPLFDVITSRALASLTQLFDYGFPLLREGGFCLFPKGKNWFIEEKEARSKWQFDLTQTPSQSHAEGVILTIRNLSEKCHGSQRTPT